MSFVYPKDVRFKCERCGICCGDTRDKVRLILLLKIEARTISQKTLMGVSEFSEQIEGFEPYVYAMKKTEEGRCIFMRDKLCSIYRVRPLICRFYPFQLQGLSTDRYGFTYTNECPGIGKGTYLKRKFFEKMFRNFTKTMGDEMRAKRNNA